LYHGAEDVKLRIVLQKDSAMSYEALMVHLDAERDSESRVQVALALADRFQAALIGVAGLALRPRFVAGGIAVYSEPAPDELQKMNALLDDLGRRFLGKGRHIAHIEWRSALESSFELVAREARAADLVILGPRRTAGQMHDLIDPGAIILRAGRPVLVVPDTVPPLGLHRAIVAWKDTRECRRAVYDATPLLKHAREVLLFEVGEEDNKTEAKKVLADMTRYLVRHKVLVGGEIWRRARAPAATEILEIVRGEKADLIVAGGYGHSRLGEWIFGGVTHELLAQSAVCCLLSH
jgi:nucleotide-binding universal stress UspA family protein